MIPITKVNPHLFKQFILYVPLNVLGMLALSCYILADTFFVANGVGSDGLTALNLVLPVYSLISGLGLLFGMGGATKYAIYQGAKNTKQASKCFTLTIALSIFTGSIITLAGLLFTEDICIFLGADNTILPLAQVYLQTIMLFAIVFILNNALVCFVRNDGSPHISMMSMVSGSVSNIFLDYLFIFPLGMGMFGAAIATCIAPIIGICTLCFHLFSHKNKLHLVKDSTQFSRIQGIVSIGFSAFVTEFSTGLVMLIFNFIILSIAGNIGVAAYGIIANLNLFAIAIFAGISEGVQPMISNSYGAGDKHSLFKVFHWSIILATIIGILLYIVIFIFAQPLANIFNRDNDPVLLHLAIQGMRLYFPLLLFTGINIVTASLFASISKAGASFLISSSRAFVLIIILVLALSNIWGMNGVWMTMPLTELLTFILSVALYYKIRKTNLVEKKGRSFS